MRTALRRSCAAPLARGAGARLVGQTPACPSSSSTAPVFGGARRLFGDQRRAQVAERGIRSGSGPCRAGVPLHRLAPRSMLLKHRSFSVASPAPQQAPAGTKAGTGKDGDFTYVDHAAFLSKVTGSIFSAFFLYYMYKADFSVKKAETFLVDWLSSSRA